METCPRRKSRALERREEEVVVIKQIIELLEDLPSEEQRQVLGYVEGLAAQYRRSVVQQEIVDPASMQGLPYSYNEPCEPAVPPDEWNAVRGLLARDSD